MTLRDRVRVRVSDRAGSGPRQLWVPMLLAALAARIVLPAAHSLENAGLAGRSASRADRAAALAVREAAAPSAPAHEPASCPVCQSLLRASPAATAPASREPLRAAREPALIERAPCPLTCVSRSGHPPRAPPACPFFLV